MSCLRTLFACSFAMSTLGVAGSAFGGPSLLPTNHSLEAEGP